MDLFGFFVKKNHPKDKKGWEIATGCFTGKFRPYKHVMGGHRNVLQIVENGGFYEFQIRFYAGGRDIYAWYRFYPAPDPDPEEIAGDPVRIRYNKRKPWIIEGAEDGEEIPEDEE